MSYLEYFKLRREPFSNTPVSQFYYNSTPHAEALTRLNHAVSTMRGLAVLVGEIGAGKTTLARRLLDSLPENEYEASLLVMVHSEVTATWLLQRIALQLGVPAPEQEKLALLGQVYQRLLEIHQSGRKAVLLIDEAQMLQTRELMEEFRGLLNLELPEQKLITFVFFGLPELDHYLKLDPPLNQRVALRIHLSSLSADATEEYIKHRLRKAGATRMPFSSEAVAAIHRHSKGTPRLINTLCDNALLEAFLAQEQVVTQRLVDKVGEGLGLGEAVEDPLAPFQNTDLLPTQGTPIVSTPLPANPIPSAPLSRDPSSRDSSSGDPSSSTPLSAGQPDPHASTLDPFQTAQLTPALPGTSFAQNQSRTAEQHSRSAPQGEEEPEGTLPAIQHYSEPTPVDDFVWPEYEEDPAPAPEHSDFEASPYPDASQSADGGFEEYQEVNPEDVEYQGFEAQGFGSEDFGAPDFGAQDSASQGFETHHGIEAHQDFGAEGFGAEDYASQNPGSLDYGSQGSSTQDFGSQDFGTQDYGSQDFGSQDFGTQDYGSQDFDSPDFGSQDFGSQDFGAQDYGLQDFGAQDYGSQDYGSQGSSTQDFGSQDFGTQDFGSQDSGSQDYGSQDFGSQDLGSQSFESPDFASQDFGSQDLGSQSFDSQDSGSQNYDSPDSGSPNFGNEDFEAPAPHPVFAHGEYEAAGTQELEESELPSDTWEFPEAGVADGSQYEGSEQHTSEWSMEPPPPLPAELTGGDDPEKAAEDAESAKTDPHPLEGRQKSQD